MSPQPRRPDPADPRVAIELGAPRKRTIGILRILDHVSTNAEARLSARAAASPDEQQHLENVARLAKELRQEIGELQRFAPTEGPE